MATIVIKDVPEELKRAYKANCARTGTSIKDATIELIEQKLQRKVYNESA